MRHIGTVKGDGILIVDGIEMGDVSYHLEGYQDMGGKSGDGYIVADAGIGPGFNSRNAATIRTESGLTFQVIITQWQVGNNRATVKSTGPVPGL